VLLSRYTGLDDIPIACPATNRNRAELERLVGFFVNAIVLRLDVSGSPTFRELLGQARMVLAEAVAHQDVPFDKVVEILRVERDPSYPPLAQVSMVMLDSESVRPKLNGLETDPFDFDNSTAHYDLSLEIYKQNGSIRIFWMYDARLFDADTVAQMAAHFEFLLEQIADSPDSRLADVSLLRESERQKVLALAAPSIPSHSAGQTLVGMFEEQAALAPNNVALIMPATAAGRRQTMSYRDLNARANRLAHYLRQLDVGPGVVVGVCLPRSLDLVIALFGILKAGGGIPSTGYDSPS
jgi:non-ribosomal peptide synthetase component F